MKTNLALTSAAASLARRIIPIAGLILVLLLTLTYAEHFENGFRFDDSHAIGNNLAIRDIRNVPSFFVDGTASSSLPTNQAYRPIATTLNAIDYWIGGGLNPVYFHVHQFFWYIVQLILMFFLLRRIFQVACPSCHNDAIALLTTAFYAFHTANAETLNYIGGRTDSFSTTCVVAALVLYQTGLGRKRFLYLVPFIIGIYTKQTAVMFAPLLFLYVAFFEEKVLENGRWSGTDMRKAYNTALKSAPAFVIGVPLFLFNQIFMTPETTVSSNTGVARFDYIMTQAWVTLHYLGNYILPMNLSADPDIEVLTSVVDQRIIYGVAVVIGLLIISVTTLMRLTTRPIAYGLLWFFVALAPTSVVPLFQVANDHRTFFPYVGLTMSVGWALGLLFHRLEQQPTARRWCRWAIPVCVILLLFGHAYGVGQRVKVWSSGESLWHDVTIKSPNNGRGLMNYGLSQMQRGRYEVALEYFDKALTQNPRYSTLQINLGVVKDALGHTDEAEEHFNKGIEYGRRDAGPHYYYARFLLQQGRLAEAEEQLATALELGPNDVKVLRLAERVREGNYGDEIQDLVNSSMTHYRASRYDKSIEASKKALLLDPENEYAFNNLCVAYNMLGEWDQAISSCQKALEIRPDFARARANLQWVYDRRAGS